MHRSHVKFISREEEEKEAEDEDKKRSDGRFERSAGQEAYKEANFTKALSQDVASLRAEIGRLQSEVARFLNQGPTLPWSRNDFPLALKDKAEYPLHGNSHTSGMPVLGSVVQVLDP